MRVADFDFDLPPELIAQTPAEPRDAARLMVLDRQSGDISHHRVGDLDKLLRPGDLIVRNASRVIPARLHGRRVTGARVEVFLVAEQAMGIWTALVRPGGRIKTAETLQMPGGAGFTFLGWENGVARLQTPFAGADMQAYLAAHGETPFPPYISASEALRERYQTVYATDPGSVAAPTAGLHFTPALLDRIQQRGIETADVILHVGLGTFLPVTAEDTDAHVMHAERYEVPAAAAATVTRALEEKRRIMAIGTTSVRVLESAVKEENGIRALPAGAGETAIFITPGYRFRAVDVLLTNFHLPASTLLMLVAAFAGRERILAAYAEAIREKYRFYSFGDAMLIV